MTAHIHHQDAAKMEEIFLTFIAAGLVGFFVGILGVTINLCFPDMNNETRALVAFGLVILCSLTPLYITNSLTLHAALFQIALTNLADRMFARRPAV